jgi:hypothetical protein
MANVLALQSFSRALHHDCNLKHQETWAGAETADSSVRRQLLSSMLPAYGALVRHPGPAGAA